MSKMDMSASIAAAWQRGHGGDPQITHLRRLSGGASSETWAFDVLQGSGTTRAILQRFAGGEQYSAGLDKLTQAAVQRAAFSAGIPVPRVLFVLANDDDLGVGYVSEQLEGETLGQRIVHSERFASARALMSRQCGTILAAIHSIPASDLPPLPVRDARQSVALLADTHRSYREAVPVFELALQWLEDHIPGCAKPTLVHGDFRTGNFIVNESGLLAVLDWEMAHLGDPIEDIGWLCVNSWRFGRIDKRVGGFGDLQDLAMVYESAVGTRIDPVSIHFWQVFGTLQWGVMCQWFAAQVVDGGLNSLERAAVGRRRSEAELDLLDLLESRDT